MEWYRLFLDKDFTTDDIERIDELVEWVFLLKILIARIYFHNRWHRFANQITRFLQHNLINELQSKEIRFELKGVSSFIKY
jgi:hypothetical protein